MKMYFFKTALIFSVFTGFLSVASAQEVQFEQGAGTAQPAATTYQANAPVNPTGAVATQTPSGMLLLCPCNSEEAANQVATSPGAVLLCPCSPGTSYPPQQQQNNMLENEFNAFGAPETPAAAPVTTDELTLSDEAPVADGSSELSLDEEEETYQEPIDVQYALDGFSAGVVFFNQNYNVKAEMLLNGVTKVDLSSKSADFQSVGVVGRYAVMPYHGLGTDLNLSVASTINHNNANFAAIITTKAELNLAYTFKSRRESPMYVFGGVGYEHVTGKEIQALLTPGGSLFQIGLGTGISKKFNIEISYSYAKHTVSDSFMDNSINTALGLGATTVDLDRSQASVTSNVVLARMIYNF